MDDEAAAAPRELARRYFQMWNTGDTSVADEILSPAWLDHAHPEVSGPSDVKRAVSAVREKRPDLRFHVESILDGGDDLVAVVGRVGSGQVTAGSRLIWLLRHDNSRMTEIYTFQEKSG